MSEIYSGYNITLKTIENKAYKGKITKIEGNSYQETREGYNKVNLEIATPYQATLEIGDNFITAKSAVNVTSSFFFINLGTLDSNKTYTIKRSFSIKQGTASGEAGGIQLYKIDGSQNTWEQTIITKNLNSNTFNPKETAEYKIRLDNVGNTAPTEELIIEWSNVILYEGTEEKPYEQYGAAPSINFPSEIKSVGDNINIFDEHFRQGAWNSTTNTTRIYSTQNAEIEAGTYTFSTNIDTSIYKVAVNSSSKEFPHTDETAFIYDSSWQTIKDITFSTKEKGFLGVGVSRLDGGNLSPEDIKNFYFKLEKGRKATPYSPLRIRKHRDI